MRSLYHSINFRPMPFQARFNFFYQFFHHENAYQDDELELRQRLLASRDHSGLDKELLQTTNTWFTEDFDQAFVNLNSNSWFFKAEYKPRQDLSREEFHIALINSQRLNWPQLSTMMRIVGDYLLLRNSELGTDHLNQPMNYVLLDLVQILKRLAMIDNPNYLKEQLPLLGNYLRAIEIHLSPMVGSDRLFLADCRRNLEENIQTDLSNKLNSQQLKNGFQLFHQLLTSVAELRHTALHFALTSTPANPHPYLEFFAKNQQRLGSNKEFPTLAAKACATSSQDLTTEIESLPTISLSSEALADCPELQLIDKLGEEIKSSYAKGLTDLQDILRFQHIIEELLHLIDQTGEVFTLLQFRQQMLTLLQGVEYYINHSQQSIVTVLEANANAYHQAIQNKQDLQWWEKLLTSRPKKIDDFIANQDNFARFSATKNELELAKQALLQQSSKMSSYLIQQAGETKQVQLISSTRALANQMLETMHAWSAQQYLREGLTLPEKAQPLSLASEPIPLQIKNQDCLEQECGPSARIQTSSATRLTPPLHFWSTAKMPIKTPQLAAEQTNNGKPEFNLPLALGLLVLLPLGLLLFKYLYDNWNNKPKPPSPASTKQDQAACIELTNLIETQLTLASHHVSETGEDFDQEQIMFFRTDLNKLKKRNDRDKLKEMKELLKDLEHFVETVAEKQEPISNSLR